MLPIEESIPTCLHPSKAQKREDESRFHLVIVEEKTINIVTLH